VSCASAKASKTGVHSGPYFTRVTCV
jgi:hypothetical protein